MFHCVFWAELLDDSHALFYLKSPAVTAIQYEKILPQEIQFYAYPNPFNSKTILTYKNLKGGEIEIYNITGQKIRTLTTANNKEGQIEWDARDALGNKVSSGIYFARAKTPRNSTTIKLIYLK